MNSIQDIRQSQNWAKYLATLGWQAFTTSAGVTIAYMQTLAGTMAKIQRPTNITQQDIEEIEKNIPRLLFIKLEPYKETELPGFRTSNLPLLPPTTVYVALEKSEEEIKKALSKNARYSINKAVRDGDTVEIIQEPQDKDLEDFHKMLVETGKRNHFYVQPFSDLVAKRDSFGKESFLMTVKGADNYLVGANFYLGHKNTIWSLHISTGKYRKHSNGGYLLIWESIRYFKSLGYTTLDMEGASDTRFPKFTKHWEGFSEFKRRFGGENVAMPRPQTKVYSPILGMLTKVTGITI